MTRLLTVGAALALALSMITQAQSDRRPAFDVASVRLSPPDSRGPTRLSPAGVDLVRISVRQLLELAFRVEPSRIDGPGWLHDVRVDIHALPPAGSTRNQIPDMVKALLADRFGFVAHFEQRSMPVNVLEVGPAGVKMREVEAVNELTKDFSLDSIQPGKPIDSTYDGLDGPGRSIFGMFGTRLGLRTVTERTMYDVFNVTGGGREFDATRMTMTELVGALKTTLDELVVDRTGLTGVYQFNITLPPPLAYLKLAGGIGITTTVDGKPITTNDPSGISAHKAVEALGLKLEKKRLPLDVVVIDSIRREPTEN